MAKKHAFTLEYSYGYYVAMDGVCAINFEEPEDQAFAQSVVDALNASPPPFIDVTCPHCGHIHEGLADNGWTHITCIKCFQTIRHPALKGSYKKARGVIPSPTIEALEAFADEQRGGIKIYSIFRRNAGWAIQWYEPERQQRELPGTGVESYHYGLVVYSYYPTFDEMVTQEFKRLKESK